MSIFLDIKTLIGEPDAGVFWTDQYIYDASNEAQLDIWAETKWATTTATLTLTASSDLTPIPATLLIPQYFLGTAGKYYTTTPAQLEQWQTGWKNLSRDYPKHLVLWDIYNLRPIPSPDHTYTYTIVGIGWPIEFNAGNQDIVAPRLIKRAITYQAAANLLENTLPDVADNLRKEAELAVNEFRVQLRNQQSHNLRRLRPASLLQVAQGGNIKIGQNLR